MYRYFLFITFIAFSSQSLGQTQKIEHLKLAVSSAKTLTNRLDAILHLCDEYETLPKDTLWAYAIRARSLAAAVNNPLKTTLAKWAQAQAYLRWDNTDSAKALIEPELAKYKVENPATRAVYFKLAQARIDCIGNSNNYKDALSEVYHIMGQSETYKDSVVTAECMNTLCAFNYDMNFLDRSRTWGYQAISYTNSDPKFYRALSGIYHNLADNYWWVGKEDSATYFINKDITLSERLENLFYLSRAYETKANIYDRQEKYQQSERAILESINIRRKIDGNIPQPDDLIGLAAIYRSAGKVDSAILVLNNGLMTDSIYHKDSPHAKKGQDSRDLQRVFYYQELARCYRIKGDSKNYEHCLEKIIEGKDAFYTANSAEAIAELETKYETQKQLATIAQQRLSIIKDSYLLYGSILFFILAGMITWLILKEIRRKQKIRLQQLQDEEKRAATQAIAKAQENERLRIAADLHDNLGAQLSYIKRNVNFIIDQPAGFNQDEELKYLNNVNDIAQNAMIDLRETIWVLNKDEVGIQEFADKLKSYLKQQLMDKDSIKWDFTEYIRDSWKLSSGEVMHIFRIMQEVTSNIIKHSGANLISLSLESNAPGNYELKITDNGRGFDPDKKYEGHYGLENISRRANEIGSTLVIDSSALTGTTICLTKVHNNANALFELNNGIINFIT